MRPYEHDDFTHETAKILAENLKTHRTQILPIGAGTGKTYIAIHTCAMMNPNANLVVICPPGKWDEKDWEKSIKSYNEVTGSNITCYSTTFGKTRNKKHQAAIYDNLKAHDYNIVILDEVHAIKGVTTGQADACIDICKSSRVENIIGLSATDVPNTPFDAAAYLILNNKYRNITDFRNQHVVRFNDYWQPVYQGPGDLKNRELYEANIKDTMVYVDASSILPKPTNHYTLTNLYKNKKYEEPLFNTEKHPFNDHQQRTAVGHYRQVLKYFRNGWFKSKQEANMLLIEIIAKDPNRKFELYTLLQDLFDTDDEKHIIIIYRYLCEKEAIESVLEELHKDLDFEIRQINGQKKQLTKSKEQKSVILLQYQAGGPGIELQYAPTSIFYAPTNSYQDFEQVKGRNVRRFMTADINHYYISTENRLDFEDWVRVHKKQKMIGEVHNLGIYRELEKFL